MGTIPGKPIVCNGVEYPSIAAFARDYGIPRRTVSNRLYYGETPEQIASGRTPIRKRGGPGLTIAGPTGSLWRSVYYGGDDG